jgi:hypothetical protein
LENLRAIVPRLTGSPAQLNVYRDVQAAADAFRAFCLENNLLDYSLQVELFRHFVWNEPLCQRFLRSSYQHLVYDNCEEDPPFVHDIIMEWLPAFSSALMILMITPGIGEFLEQIQAPRCG